MSAVFSVTRFERGDRIRVDNRGEYHGRHGEIAGTAGGSSKLAVALDNGAVHEFDPEHLRPVPTVEMTFTEREYDTLTNIWDEGVREIPREMDTETLWDIKQQVGEAVVESYADDDMDALGILLSVEVKITQVLGERQNQQYHDSK